MISASGLSYSYGGQPPMVFSDFSIEKGEALLVLGSSGTGKTTLLHLLAGLMRPSKGKIIIGETNICALNGRSLDQFRGEHIGIVFQQNHFISSLNVLENLKLAQYLSGRNQDDSKCMMLLKRLNIEHKAKSSTSTLSEGERQRVALARALVNNQDLILADEPTSALDDANTNEVVKLLLHQAHEAGAGLIIVTHDARLKEVVKRHIILDHYVNAGTV